MFHPIWRLNDAGADNLGLACADKGLFLGRTPLIERQGGRFVVRDPQDIQRLLSRSYRTHVDAKPLMGGLATVAAALNANDLLLARIAAVHRPQPLHLAVPPMLVRTSIFMRSSDELRHLSEKLHRLYADHGKDGQRILSRRRAGRRRAR